MEFNYRPMKNWIHCG